MPSRSRRLTGLPAVARRLNVPVAPFAYDRRSTALSLELLNRAHGERFYELHRDAATDEAAAAASFAGRSPVIDVQTHIIDEKLWSGPMASALSTFNALVDPDRWRDGMDPRMTNASMWAALVFGASETTVALLTSTPGQPGENILENGQIAAVRDVVDHYAGTGRLLSHTIIHPNIHRDEIDRMPDHVKSLKPSAWKVYTMYGPPTAAAPEGGWYLDDEEIGLPFLDQVMRLRRPEDHLRPQGFGWPDSKRIRQVDLAPRHRTGGESISRNPLHHLSLGLRTESSWSGRRTARGEPGWRRSPHHERSCGRHRS